jgi:hypothetical protein
MKYKKQKYNKRENKIEEKRQGIKRRTKKGKRLLCDLSMRNNFFLKLSKQLGLVESHTRRRTLASRG